MSQHEDAPAPGAAVHHLRQAAASRVERSSLRKVAREIGMSPTGLKKFLQGTAPYSPTLRRLRSWYVQHADDPAETMPAEAADAALAVLMDDLPPEPRRRTADGVLECLGHAYDLSGRGRPAWVAELRARYGPSRPAA
jgi:hypothetical protein